MLIRSCWQGVLVCGPFHLPGSRPGQACLKPARVFDYSVAMCLPCLRPKAQLVPLTGRIYQGLGSKVIRKSDQESGKSLSPECLSLGSLKWQRVNSGGMLCTRDLERTRRGETVSAFISFTFMVIDWPFISPRLYLSCYPKGLEVQTLDVNQIGHFTALMIAARFDVASFCGGVQCFVIIIVMGQGAVGACT